MNMVKTTYFTYHTAAAIHLLQVPRYLSLAAIICVISVNVQYRKFVKLPPVHGQQFFWLVLFATLQYFVDAKSMDFVYIHVWIHGPKSYFAHWLSIPDLSGKCAKSWQELNLQLKQWLYFHVCMHWIFYIAKKWYIFNIGKWSSPICLSKDSSKFAFCYGERLICHISYYSCSNLWASRMVTEHETCNIISDSYLRWCIISNQT